MKKIVPWKQALCYTIERALTTYDWLKEQQEEYERNRINKVDASKIVRRVRVLCDVFSVYLTTLVDGGKNKTYSLKEFRPDMYARLKDLEIVKKCKDNRHNRSAHEAESYGHFVNANEILNSNIRDTLLEVRIKICTD